MDDGVFSNTWNSVRDAFGDVWAGARDVLVAREQTRAAQVQQQTATTASRALMESETAKLRLVVTALAGLAALWLVTRPAKARA